MDPKENKDDDTSQGRGTFQDPLEIPVGDGGSTQDERKETMPEINSTNLIEQGMGQLSQTGVIAQNNFVTVQKALDYDFMENRRIITLDEAVGVREVASKSVPAGPTSG